MSYFHMVIEGNVGTQPESRMTRNGVQVTNLTLAYNERWTNSNGQPVERVTWFRVAFWGRLAEIAHEYVKKGSRILIEGKLLPDANGNPVVFNLKNGDPASSYEVRADRLVLLDPPPSRNEDSE